jgi:NADPH:quinone reductase-like Zn-dependent oxidoreductase
MSSLPASLPHFMAAVLLKAHGGYEQLEYREDVPVPQPQAGEVLIRVAAAGVNNTDINTRIGWYAKEQESTAGAGKLANSSWSGSTFHFPRIQGADACGRVVAVGEGVAATRLGERVIVDPIHRAISVPNAMVPSPSTRWCRRKTPAASTAP